MDATRNRLVFSNAYRWYALTTLSAVYMLNLVDRGLVAVLLQPIKQDLHLSDTQLGFLTGIAFSLFYAILGIPIARWADRGNRVTITAMAIALWGVTVMSCLFVGSFVQMVFARMAAAVGESGCKPPTYSLVGDYFPEPSRRARAMSIYLSGSAVATLVSFIGGGWLNEHFGWRMTFCLMGFPGLLLAVLVKLTLVEPRTLAAKRDDEKLLRPSVSATLSVLWNRRACRHLCIALVVLFMLGQGFTPWYAAFMIRSHGMSTAEAGLWLGLVFSLGGFAGTLLGGYVASRWFSDNDRGQMRLCAATVAAISPCFVAFLTLPGRTTALLSLIPLIVAYTFFLGPVYALLQRLVEDEMRATLLALVMLLANLIGAGIGPQIVGILSDLLHAALGQDSLRYAMLLMSAVAFWAAYHIWLAGRTVRDDLSLVSGSTTLPHA